MKTFKPNLRMIRRSFFLLGITCCLVQEAKAQQQTPQELGSTMFRYFKTSSVDSLMQLQVSFDEVIKFTVENGIDVDTAQVSAFRKSYPLVMEKYRSRYLEIMDDGLPKKSDWSLAKTDSITVQKHEINMTPTRSANISMMTVYFRADGKKYRIVTDIYNSKGIWKLGSNIDFFNDSLKKK